MTQKGREFAKYLSDNPEVAEKLNAKDNEGADKMGILLAFAKEEGYELTAEDLQAEQSELSKDELATVAGGAICGGAVGGGGTASDDGSIPACGCVAYGQGNDVPGGDNIRCMCLLGGSGSETYEGR